KILSLYENATIVCGLLWGINSFDQWGVELGKELSQKILAEIQSKDIAPGEPAASHDSSTTGLISAYKKRRRRSS
ncbi:MAG TPA: glucose-6-phosphate isomerase, partial [Desulfobacteraceae bacterium]|nr:glucose-6-phosphate isomerase [Desulfobacteraceae bacterium]